MTLTAIYIYTHDIYHLSPIHQSNTGAGKCPKVSLGVERQVSATAGGARWNSWRGGAW